MNERPPANEAASSLGVSIARLAPTADLVAAAVAYLAGFALRLTMWQTPVSYLETGQFLAADRLWSIDERNNIHYLFEETPFSHEFHFWWRPALSILLAPAAQWSFEAFRLFHIALASMLPVLAILLLRAFGAARPFRYGSALVVAVHPVFVPWGAIVVPDTLMTLALAAGLWAHLSGRPWLAATSFVIAVWTKEVAAVSVLVVLVHEMARSREGMPGGSMLRNFTLPARLYAGVLAVAFVPLGTSLLRGGPLPGWAGPSSPLDLLDRAFLVTWCGLLLVVGLAWPRTRLPAALALMTPLAFLLRLWVTDQGTEIYYFVVSGFWTVVAVALVLDEWSRRRPARSHRPHSTGRTAVGAVLAGLVAVQTFVPPSLAWKAPLAMPLTRESYWSLDWHIEYDRHRDGELLALERAIRAHVPDTLFVVDEEVSLILYPLSYSTRRLVFSGSAMAEMGEAPIAPWVDQIERGANLTVVRRSDQPMNEAIRNVYADCTVHTNAVYVVLDARPCSGRGDQLKAEFERLREARQDV